MKYNKLKQKHDKVELEVATALIKEIRNSKTESKFVNTKALKVNVFDYQELVFIHDQLLFIDSRGLQYSLYVDCSLEDLIDILTKI